MSGDMTGLLVALGLFLFMILYWVYYILGVRRAPKSEAWYDAGDEHGAKASYSTHLKSLCRANTPFARFVHGFGPKSGRYSPHLTNNSSDM